MEKIIIFDTTLRDGEQAPGASMTAQQKLDVGYQLERLGVNVIEAGFPIASPGDFQGVETVAARIRNSSVCALARCVKADIESACKAVAKARMPRVHVFLAISKIHLEFKFKKSEDEILQMAVDGVRMARKGCDDIEFSPEDATRSNRPFLYRVIEAAVKEGARTINIPDTVGYSYPQEIHTLITDIRSNVPNINKAVISIHCHDDLGMSTANSLTAVLAGARQVHCTVNGIGERAGNAALEEFVMALKTRKDIFGGFSTDINTKEIFRTSRLVSSLTDFVIPLNKAVVGKNAFRHESGIHQDAVLKQRTTYEIMDPADIGITSSDQIVLGKHSGRHAFRDRLETLGLHLDDEQLNKAFARFKEVADKKKDIYDDDLRIIAEDEVRVAEPVWQFESFEVHSGTNVKPQATVKVIKNSKSVSGISTGDGPVDACFKAIDKMSGRSVKLEDFHLESVTSGRDALGQVSLVLESKGKRVGGRGASTDVIEAAVRAYLDALNKLEAK
jgi:2-isopropylmalate synthase